MFPNALYFVVYLCSPSLPWLPVNNNVNSNNRQPEMMSHFFFSSNLLSNYLSTVICIAHVGIFAITQLWEIPGKPVTCTSAEFSNTTFDTTCQQWFNCESMTQYWYPTRRPHRPLVTPWTLKPTIKSETGHILEANDSFKHVNAQQTLCAQVCTAQCIQLKSTMSSKLPRLQSTYQLSYACKEWLAHGKLSSVVLCHSKYQKSRAKYNT